MPFDFLTRSWRPYLLLILLCCAFYLPGLTRLPPTDRDEARFAQASRQMLESGNYIDIRFQNVPRYKKPIGVYWLQAAAAGVVLAAAAPVSMLSVPKRFSYSVTTLPSSRLRRFAAKGLMTMRSVSWIVTSF